MTHTVLHLNASARHQNSVSRLNSRRVVEHLNGDTVVTRDLASGVPFLDETWAAATFTPPADRTEAQAAALSLSDELVAEVQAADTIVIGTAMYNFGIPATFKAWIDQIGRAGVTFAYTETCPKGLLEGKKVIVILATGGTPVGSEYDFASPYLRFVFGFLGITDVTIVDAEGAEALAQAA